MLSDAVSRGKIDVIIFLKELHDTEQTIQINWSLLNAFLQAKKELSQTVPMEEKWTMQEIVSLDQVLQVEKIEFMQEEIIDAVKMLWQKQSRTLLRCVIVKVRDYSK